jgi:outer membrane protein assembly factor BamB
MKVVKRIWNGTSAAERLLLAIAVLGLLSTAAFAAWAFVKRPGDVSNPNADFREGQRLDKKPQTEPEDRSVDWPRFGYDFERTKFLYTPRVRPPFRKLWKYEQDQLIEFAPVIAGNRMYMIDNDGVFITLNKDTGKVVWKKQLGKLNASSPAFWRGMLLAVNLEPRQAMGVRARDGKVLWKRDLPGRAESSPLVHGETMYFGTESGDFFALDARTGKARWSVKLDGSVKAAPAFAQGTLYVGDYAGKMYGIRAKDGAIRWRSGDLGSGLGSGRFYSTPAVAFGRVYAGNVDGRVYSFDRQTGEIAWTFSAGNYVYSGVAVADGPRIKPSVYFGSHDRNVYAVDAKSGKQIWKARPGGQVSGPATVIGDTVYVSTFSGNSTSGFRLQSGRRVFKVRDGEYGPAVSDGERLYVTGGASVIAYKPVKIGNYKRKPKTKGIVPPAEWRKARGKQPGPRAERQAGKPSGQGRRAKGTQARKKQDAQARKGKGKGGQAGKKQRNGKGRQRKG